MGNNIELDCSAAFNIQPQLVKVIDLIWRDDTLYSSGCDRGANAIAGAAMLISEVKLLSP